MRLIKSVLLLCLVASCNKGDQTQTSSGVAETSYQVSGAAGQLTSQNNGDLVLMSLTSMAQAPRPTLIGGEEADPKEFPASFTTSHSGSRCTGTMIGPKALQLAAHCVGNGRTATISLNGKTYSSVCTHSPKYKDDATADYALCVMSEPVDLPWYENILLPSQAKMKVGDKILLAGMGCTQPGGGGGNNGVFRIGEAPIERMPSGNNDIITNGNSALCFGDSGGSAFWKDENGVYKIAGINSRGDIQTTSYLSAVFTKDANDFYTQWVQKNNAQICGLSDSAPKCRGADTPVPPPSPVPEWCRGAFDRVEKCIFGNPRLSLSNPQACRDDYAKLFACQQASERNE